MTVKLNYLYNMQYMKPFNCLQTNELWLFKKKCRLQTIRLQIVYIKYIWLLSRLEL